MGDSRFLTTYGEMAEILEQLPMIVRETRRARRISLQTMSEESGLSMATLSRLERLISRTSENMETGRGGMSMDNTIRILRWLDGPPEILD